MSQSDSDPDDLPRDRLPSPLRSSLDPERELVTERLQDAFAHDALTLDQLDERLELARSAQTTSELVVLVRDLPGALALPDADALTHAARPTRSALVPNRSPADAPNVELVSAVFGSVEREDVWTPPPRIRARAVFGSVELDFRRALLAPGQVVEVECSAVFGSIELKVPPGVVVESRGAGWFGSFASRPGEADNNPDAPRIIVRGRAVFGSVEVERKRDKSLRGRAQQRALRNEDDDDSSNH